MTIQSVNRISRVPADLLSELRSVLVLLSSRSIGAQRHTDLTVIKFGPHLGEEVQDEGNCQWRSHLSARHSKVAVRQEVSASVPGRKRAAARFRPIRDANSALARP